MAETGLSLGAAVWPTKQRFFAKKSLRNGAEQYCYSFSSTCIYRRLNPLKNEIRLLTLATTKSFVKLILCRIHTVSLNNPPPYHALSYTWGSWEDSEDIYLEGCMYKVTKNLAAVLRRLAQDTSGPQNFWIDAICINQDDPYERNHQVKKMRAIYEQADCVKIWLGEEEQRSDLAFTLAHQLVDYNARGEDTSLLINDPRIARHFRAFQLLLWRPYWRRVWVIQEVYSAKQAEVFCGAESITWANLLRAQNIINSNRSALWKLVKDEPQLSGFATDIWYEGPRSLLSHIGSHNPTLFEALRWHCGKLSSLPEDKVYALLGITTMRDDPRIVIDYTQGVRQVYINTARYIIQTTKKIDVICSMQRISQSLLTLPSWVVDWVDIYPSSLISGSLGVFEAAGNTEADTVFSPNGETLTTRGFCIGTISVIGQHTMLVEKEKHQKILALSHDFHQSRLGLGPPDNVSVDELIVFCKNFTCGRILREAELFAGRSDEEARQIILGLFALSYPKKDFQLGRPLIELRAQVSDTLNQAELEMWSRVIMENLYGILDCRRFFTCQSGLQGSAYYQATIGCEICILSGCATPVVLRPVGNIASGDGNISFEVVGDAYVDGYMNGEGIVELEQNKHRWREFVIV